jgi:ATP-dependent DNA helicase DinG
LEKQVAAAFSTISEFFQPGGPLCAVLQDYEHRPQQVEMAQAVASAISDREHLIIEAGTGVGKSLAYLLPAFLSARQANEPVIVSTYTKNLQEQLLEKDIPLLETALGDRIRAVAALGRANYLCLRRLSFLRKWEPTLFERQSLTDELVRIQEWAFTTEEGSLSDLEFEPNPGLWEKIS